MPAREPLEKTRAETNSMPGLEPASGRVQELSLVFLVLIAGMPLCLFLFSFLSPWLMLAELAVNFQVQWFAGLIAAGLILLWYRRWWLALIVWLASAVCLVGIASIYFPDPDNPPPAAAARLRVMSYNVLVHNRQQAAVLAEIRRHDPDVLVIVEYTPFWKQAIDDLRGDYPHALEEPRVHGFGIALFSKLPLAQPRTVRDMPAGGEMPALQATVDFAGRPLEIVGAHLINPLGSAQLALRDRQFEALTGELAAAPVERVVVGDFNCTTWSQDMREFLARTGLRDSRQGFGLRPSWSPPGMPFLAIPIDHALVSRGLSVLDRQTGNQAGSDHRPVIVDLAWPQATTATGNSRD